LSELELDPGSKLENARIVDRGHLQVFVNGYITGIHPHTRGHSAVEEIEAIREDSDVEGTDLDGLFQSQVKLHDGR
jgi:hypothetical protein